MKFRLFYRFRNCCALLLAVLLFVPAPLLAKKANRLQQEQSPYLLQHAYNPVDWFPWGDEAFAKARKEGKLIFLSIGYSTCHWCHVMEEESFDDDEVATLLRHDFVAIKVDREERPDIDQFYMQVCIELNGSGGWPLTVIMTPDKTPIFAGTYLPKKRRYNRPGLLELLPQVAEAWRSNPARLANNGKIILDRLEQRHAASTETATLSTLELKQAETTLRQSFDRQRGGFGEAPKFPRPHSLSFLLQRYYKSGDEQLLQMVEKTLQAMRHGGIYDQIGFGFHRYSTDADWLVPHFEKMLYDQAGLARVYLEAYQLTQKTIYAETAREIFAYVFRQMRDPSGGFYSAEDADSDGVEGKFYLWQQAQLTQLLGKQRGERFARIFNVQPSGNFGGEIPQELPNSNILHLQQPLADWARQLKIPLPQLLQQLADDRQRLFAARDKRVHPFRDDKVISAWNGQMISALALAGRALEDPKLLQAAEQAAAFILAEMRNPQGQLLRRWRGGQAAIPGFAADYAFMARALLDLYHSKLEPDYLQQAQTLAERLHADFTDQRGQLFETTTDSELPLRTSELYDGALPSAGSVAIEVYARLYLLTGNKLWSQRAEALLKTSAVQIKRYPAGYTQFLLGASLLLESSRELVIVGASDSADTAALVRETQRHFMPDTSLLLRPMENPAVIDKLAPFTAGMKSLKNRATAYLCQDFACQRPQTEPGKLVELLK